MCSVYEDMSMLYFFKTLIFILAISIPILLVISGSVDVLKGTLSGRKNYRRPIIKLFIAMMVLVIPLNIGGLSSKFNILNCWNDANIDNLATIVADENNSTLAYVPVVVEPMYITNPYKIDVEKLKNEIQALIKDKDISVSFYNPLSDQGFDINGDKEYIAASVSKVHAVLNLYDWAYENNVDLTKITMRYHYSDYQGGSGILQGKNKNRDFTLYELSEYAIRYSDNIAWNMVRRFMQNKRTNTSYYKDLVDSDVVVRQGTYIITANWATEIMKKIYYNEDNNPYYDKLIEDMKNTTAHSKIDKYLDYDIVAHKTGSLHLGGYLYENDTAIIYSDNEYILTILSKSKFSSDQICDLIGQISELVYKEILKTK